MILIQVVVSLLQLLRFYYQSIIVGLKLVDCSMIVGKVSKPQDRLFDDGILEGVCGNVLCIVRRVRKLNVYRGLKRHDESVRIMQSESCRYGDEEINCREPYGRAGSLLYRGVYELR